SLAPCTPALPEALPIWFVVRLARHPCGRRARAEREHPRQRRGDHGPHLSAHLVLLLVEVVLGSCGDRSRYRYRPPAPPGRAPVRRGSPGLAAPALPRRTLVLPPADCGSRRRRSEERRVGEERGWRRRPEVR